MNLALAQINPTVGDLAGNLALIETAISDARAAGAQVLVLPELAVCGYPPEDLLLRADFLADCQAAVQRVADAAGELVVMVGYPERTDHGVYNALAVCQHGRLLGTHRKAHLPTYGVFDEKRTFDAPPVETSATLVRVDGRLVGLTVCEDIWLPGAPLADEALAGAELIVNVSASPYRVGIMELRREMLAARARDNLVAVAYCNQVGGQDELVFDGGSMVLDHRGELLARAGQYTEELLLCPVDLGPVRAARLRDPRYRGLGGAPVPVIADLTLTHAAPLGAGPVAPLLGREAEIYGTLVLAVRDYARKSGFTGVVYGNSGGIDSALVGLVAADALGPENVTAVVMPSPHSSHGTQQDARDLATNLGLDLREIPIGPLMAGFGAALAPALGADPSGVTAENLQARIRGTLLMAISNAEGVLLLSTGNKSESAVGYCTLYGDMAGGFAVLKDVAKLDVFAVTRWRAALDGSLPETIITRPPSAELSPGQADSDSLPPYETLDPVLRMYVEEDLTPAQIVAAGYPQETVDRTVGMVNRAEFKRRQAAPGPKVSARAFSRDRRVPIINRYRPGTLAPAAAQPAS